MKKHLLSILALVVALAALVLAGFSSAQQSARIDALEAEVLSLREELTQLSVPSELPSEAPVVDDSEAFCNLVVLDWNAGSDTLTMDLSALAALPTGAALSAAQLYLDCGSTMQVQDIALHPGEGDSCFEADLSGITFPIPELTEGAELELTLLVTFTGGRTISTYGASWYMEDGQLWLISG